MDMMEKTQLKKPRQMIVQMIGVGLKQERI
jgi:hypothetical protein